MPIENNPTVSVVIPTYNRAHLVGRAIQSVLNQTYQDFEIIVVDDCSSDNTEVIIKKIQEQDKRIRYIKLRKHRGGAVARNVGIKAAKNKYIAFQDSDDVWLSAKLEKQVDVFKNVSYNVGVVYTGFWRVENNEKIYIPSHWVTKKEGDIHTEILYGNYIATPAAVVKKECFDKAGIFDESLPRLQDWELWIRISNYYHFRCIDEPLLFAYHIPSGITANQNALSIAVDLISEKHSGVIKKNKKILSKFYLYLGSLLSSNNKIKKGRNYLIKAIKADPFNIKALLLAFVSFFGLEVFKRVSKIYQKIKVYQRKGE